MQEEKKENHTEISYKEDLHFVELHGGQQKAEISF